MKLAMVAVALIVFSAPTWAHDITVPIRLADAETPSDTPGQSASSSPPPWHELTAAPPKLTAGLGDHSYNVSTSSGDAQKFFNQGLIYAYAFNQPEAFRAFRHAERIDPGCAMCVWGQAYVLGPNLNIAMDERALETAQAAAARAVAKAADETDKERALARALLARYRETGERAENDKRYADAMVAVARRFPDDPDIAALAAEALMLLSPWDYWLDAGRTPKAATSQALAILERALQAHPGHIGAAHFYIHLVEASADPGRAIPYADRLRMAAPEAGHLVHMPSHIYMRVGRIHDSLEDNRRAARADERYLDANRDVKGPYGLLYYPHNVHFELIAALMSGNATSSLAAAEKLMGLISEETAVALPPVQPIKQAPYFAYAQFGAPDRILALPEPNPELPFVRAAWHFARGVAHLERRDLEAARAEAAQIGSIVHGDLQELETYDVPAKAVVDIARNVLNAQIALRSGDQAEAQRLAKLAAEVERELPYMEPAYWYMPVSHTLGAILLKSGDSRGAAASFEAALEVMPNSAWALKGLLEAARANGETAKAAETQQRLDQALSGGSTPPDLDRL